MAATPPPPRLTVYFDGGCPLCRREISFYQRQRGAERIEWLDLTAPGTELLATDLTREQAMSRFHVRRVDGTLLAGARAFAELWQALPRFHRAGRLAALPGVVSLLELGYHIALRLRRLWRGQVQGAARCEARCPGGRD